MATVGDCIREAHACCSSVGSAVRWNGIRGIISEIRGCGPRRHLLGNEKLINFAYWIGGEGYGNGSSGIHIDIIVWSIYVIIIKNKRYKVVPFICLDIILTFAGFAITSFVILFVRNEALERC